MITTKRNELEVINSFNDLMKDTKEKQKINKLVKQYSNEYFMEKLSDADLEDNIDPFDIFQELSSHYQKYAFEIAKRVKEEVIDKYRIDEEYYDGYRNWEKDSCDNKGFQVAKTRRIIDTKKVGENFEEDLEEELINLVIEDYFKNLNKALEIYNFNTKIEKLKKNDNSKRLNSSKEDIKNIIYNNIESTYNYYSKKDDKETILYNFRYNRQVINYLLENILSDIHEQLEIRAGREDIESLFTKEINMFIKLKEKERVEEKETNIPLGWKAYAITKFIDKILK